MSTTTASLDVGGLADRLAAAVRERRAIAPLSDDVELDLRSAYAVRDATLDRLVPGWDRGDGPRAAKLGLTSRAKQTQMGVAEPLYGWYRPGDGLEVGAPLEVGTLIQPKAEPEIAFLTGRALGGAHVTAADVLAATDAVMPALDVLDSRFLDYRFTLPDVVADDCSAGRYLVGAPVSPRGLDLATTGCVFEADDRLVATAAGAAVLGHPAAAVAWFVRALSAHDRELAAGSLVLSGSLTQAVTLTPGTTVRVTLDRLGALELTCS